MTSFTSHEKWLHHNISFHFTSLIFMASLFHSHLRTSSLTFLSMLDPAEYNLYITFVRQLTDFFLFFISHNSVPPVFKKKIHDLEIKVGSAASFECEIEDAPNVTFKWFKSNSELRQSEKYRIINHHMTSCLELLNSTKADSGVYTCHASNNHGTDSCSAKLNIAGKLMFCLPCGMIDDNWDLLAQWIVNGYT